MKTMMWRGVVIASGMLGLFACGLDSPPSADESADGQSEAEAETDRAEVAQDPSLADAPEAGQRDASDGVERLASSCAGVRIEHIATPSPSNPSAFLDVYFDAATGNNCAMMVSAGSAAGKATFIGVRLTRCKETSPGPRCTPDGVSEDFGPFHSFAGPVFQHAPGRCISAFGELDFNGTAFFAELAGATHCG